MLLSVDNSMTKRAMQTRGPSGRPNVVVLEGASIVEEAEALNREWIEIILVPICSFLKSEIQGHIRVRQGQGEFYETQLVLNLQNVPL